MPVIIVLDPPGIYPTSLCRIGPAISEESIEIVIADQHKEILTCWLQPLLLDQHHELRNYLLLQCCRYAWFDQIYRIIDQVYEPDERLSLLRGDVHEYGDIETLTFVLDCLYRNPVRCCRLSNRGGLMNRYPYQVFETCLHLIAPIQNAGHWITPGQILIHASYHEGPWLTSLFQRYCALFPGWNLLTPLSFGNPQVLPLAVDLLGTKITTDDFLKARHNLVTRQLQDEAEKLTSLIVASPKLPWWKKVWIIGVDFVRTVFA